MPTYRKAQEEIREQVMTVMDAYHGQLRDAGVLVDVLLANPNLDANGDPIGPAIRVHGYAAVACIRVLSYKDRVIRGFDAEMTIDADHWETAGAAEQVAIIDHELTHLELVTNDVGVVRDDAERPKLRCRKHDRHFGWFDLVARRHGEHSLEVQQARDMLKSATFKQCYLFDLDGDADTGRGDDLDVEFSTGGKTAKTTLGTMKKLKDDLKANGRPTKSAGRRNVRCADGRRITPAEMAEEITRDFAGAR